MFILFGHENQNLQISQLLTARCRCGAVDGLLTMIGGATFGVVGGGHEVVGGRGLIRWLRSFMINFDVYGRHFLLFVFQNNKLILITNFFFFLVNFCKLCQLFLTTTGTVYTSELCKQLNNVRVTLSTNNKRRKGTFIHLCTHRHLMVT